jgi:hypothetical protein
VEGVDTAMAFSWQNRTVPPGGEVTLKALVRAKNVMEAYEFPERINCSGGTLAELGDCCEQYPTQMLGGGLTCAEAALMCAQSLTTDIVIDECTAFCHADAGNPGWCGMFLGPTVVPDPSSATPLNVRTPPATHLSAAISGSTTSQLPSAQPSRFSSPSSFRSPEKSPVGGATPRFTEEMAPIRYRISRIFRFIYAMPLLLE